MAVLGGAAGQVSLWDFSDADPRHLDTVQEFKGAVDRLECAGDVVAAWQYQGDTDIVLFRLAGCKLARWQRIKRPKGYIVGSGLSSDGKTIAIGLYSGSAPVILYDLRGEKPVELTQISSGILPDSRALTCSPDGRILAVAGEGRRGEVTLVDLPTGKPLRSWTFPGIVSRLRFAPDGRHLFTFNANGTIYILRLDDPYTLARRPGSIPGLAQWKLEVGTDSPRPAGVKIGVSPDGLTLATGTTDGKAKLWDMQETTARKELRHHRKEIQLPSWSHDGKHLATASSEDGMVVMWTAEGQKEWVLDNYQLNHPWALGVKFAPDDRTVLAGTRIVDTQTGQVAFHIREHHDGHGFWSTDGKAILTNEGTFSQFHLLFGRWEQRQGMADWSFKGPDKVNGIGWSRDGRRGIRLGLTDLEVVDPSGALISSLSGVTYQQQSSQWSADCSLLAQGDAVFDTATGKRLCRIPFRPNSLGWSADGQLLAANDIGRVAVFDPKTGDPVGGVMQFFEGGEWLVVGAEGHYRCSPGVEKHLVYIARTADGKEERLSAADFAKKYRWTNDPAKATLLPKGKD